MKIAIYVPGRLNPTLCDTVAQAAATYCEARDAHEAEDGPTGDPWPDGRLTIGTRAYRVSQNGRIWDGASIVEATHLDRAALCEVANAEPRRHGYPTLDVEADLPTLTRWLQCCDPNGCHLPHLADAEDMDQHTIETAWAGIADMLAEVVAS